MKRTVGWDQRARERRPTKARQHGRHGGPARPESRWSHPTKRRGLSLLEVMLALTIFGMAMAALGELIRIGAKCSSDARELTTAQLYGESIMAELVAGQRTPDPVLEPTPVELGLNGIDPDWNYTIQLTPAEQPNLVSVTVMVERNIPDRRRATFTLVRWMQDPGIVFPDEEPAETTSSTTPETTSGTSPTGGASG